MKASKPLAEEEARSRMGSVIGPDLADPSRYRVTRYQRGWGFSRIRPAGEVTFGEVPVFIADNGCIDRGEFTETGDDVCDRLMKFDGKKTWMDVLNEKRAKW